MPSSQCKDIESPILIDLEKKMCVLAMTIYNDVKFKLYNIHFLCLFKYLQFLAYKLDILNICLKQLWKTQLINKTFCQFIYNNSKWFQEKMVFYSTSQFRNKKICNYYSQHLSKNSSNNKNIIRLAENITTVGSTSKTFI